MAQRNWACDNIVWSYFGTTYLNASGELGFKAGLFQCMIGAALNMQTVVESHRASNFYGTLEWQASAPWSGGSWPAQKSQHHNTCVSAAERDMAHGRVSDALQFDVR